MDETFGELGINSLNLIKILNLLRQEKDLKVEMIDINILLNNPTIRQLAKAIDLLALTHPITETEIDQKTEMKNLPKLPRSLTIELLGIICLIYLFILPIYFAYHSVSIIAPILHLFSYVFFQYLFNLSLTDEDHLIYSSVYYHWWLLQRLWKLNSLWHRLLYGTSLYNVYLRIYGKQIQLNTHIRSNAFQRPV
jgi:hypothetical protein